jgi:hypothetical protein
MARRPKTVCTVFTLPSRVTPVVLAVGSGMHAGKTTVVSRAGRALTACGRCTALLKLIKSISHRDIYEYAPTGVPCTREFSDDGVPLTCRIEEFREGWS